MLKAILVMVGEHRHQAGDAGSNPAGPTKNEDRVVDS